jgi:hypothetical protein
MRSEEVLIAIDAEALEAARAEALPEAHLQMIVEAFQALSDPTRARILYALIKRPMCVRSLAPGWDVGRVCLRTRGQCFGLIGKAAP